MRQTCTDTLMCDPPREVTGEKPILANRKYNITQATSVKNYITWTANATNRTVDNHVMHPAIVQISSILFPSNINTYKDK